MPWIGSRPADEPEHPAARTVADRRSISTPNPEARRRRARWPIRSTTPHPEAGTRRNPAGRPATVGGPDGDAQLPATSPTRRATSRPCSPARWRWSPTRPWPRATARTSGPTSARCPRPVRPRATCRRRRRPDVVETRPVVGTTSPGPGPARRASSAASSDRRTPATAERSARLDNCTPEGRPVRRSSLPGRSPDADADAQTSRSGYNPGESAREPDRRRRVG